jgi:hypothetical protein
MLNEKFYSIANAKKEKTEKRKLSSRERTTAILRVAKLTFRAAPLAVIVKVTGSIVTAVLPIVTTYFAGAHYDRACQSLRRQRKRRGAGASFRYYYSNAWCRNDGLEQL